MSHDEDSLNQGKWLRLVLVSGMDPFVFSVYKLSKLHHHIYTLLQLQD
jgi:hypothetical protein